MPSHRMPSARELIGRTIVDFDPGPVRVHTLLSDNPNGRGPMIVMHYPRITLDDGSVLHFQAEEHPQGADYGVFIRRNPRKRAKGKS